jgi:hypothetical protein
MVPLLSLWLPIVLSAVAVFIVSSLVHMLLPYHRSDFKTLPDDDGVRAALRPFAIPPGDYVVPGMAPGEKWDSPARLEKMKEGPSLLMTVYPSGPPAMGASLAMWFVYSLLVGLFAAYVVGGLMGPGAEYLHVHRYVGAVAFAGYGLALLQGSIWYKRSWSATLKSVFDALIYALVTGGVFGWLWPAV